MFERASDGHGVIPCSLMLRTACTGRFPAVDDLLYASVDDYVWYHVRPAPPQPRLAPTDQTLSRLRDALALRIARKDIYLCCVLHDFAGALDRLLQPADASPLHVVAALLFVLLALDTGIFTRASQHAVPALHAAPLLAGTAANLVRFVYELVRAAAPDAPTCAALVALVPDPPRTDLLVALVVDLERDDLLALPDTPADLVPRVIAAAAHRKPDFALSVVATPLAVVSP